MTVDEELKKMRKEIGLTALSTQGPTESPVVHYVYTSTLWLISESTEEVFLGVSDYDEKEIESQIDLILECL